MSKNEQTRLCRCCREKDIVDNLFSVKRVTSTGHIQGWWFHEDCMLKKNYTKESLELLLNDTAIETEDLSKKLFLDSKILLNYKANKIKNINKNILGDSNGTKIKSGSPIQIINKTYHAVNLVAKEKISGVYGIKNIINNKVYIGSSINIEQRLKSHFRQLLKGNHDNYKLQNDYNSYGNDGFEFWILEVIDGECKTNDKLLYLTEQKYIDISNSFLHGYNIHPIAGFYGTKEDYDILKSSSIS